MTQLTCKSYVFAKLGGKVVVKFNFLAEVILVGFIYCICTIERHGNLV